MEISSFRSLVEMGMDDHIFSHQWPVSSLEQDISFPTNASLLSEDLHQSSPQQPFMDFKPAQASSHIAADRPLKQLKTIAWNSHKSENFSNSNFNYPTGMMTKPKEETWSSSNAPIPNFPCESVVSQSSFGNHQNFIMKPFQGPIRITTNTRLVQAQDHILAERKRREKLGQRFIALSALVPGLKKMDKASVLEDATKYMKQLQEKVKILEEQAKKRSIESVVFVKKYEVYADGENSSSDESFSSGPIVTEPLPEIQARFCNKDVLIIIHCEKRKGVLEKAD